MTQAAALAAYGSNSPSNRNRIINGDMRIDQRNAGASVSCDSNAYSLDRWQHVVSQASKLTVQQNAGSVTPPVGFSKYIGFTSTSAYSVGTTEYFYFQQTIEGNNIADLAWGTASAAPITLSFRVYSSLTGTFGGSLQNNAKNRSYPFTYTVSSANTWTTISITIAGDTTGTWLTTNSAGITVIFGLGVGLTSLVGTAGAWASADYRSATGATSVVGTSGATFYITGVQLEEGSVATPFEHRQYGQELALCQRYYQKISGSINGGPFQIMAICVYEASTTAWGTVPLRATMRSQPTVTYSGSFTTSFGTAGTLLSDTNQIGGDVAVVGWTGGSGGTNGMCTYFRANNSSAVYISFSSEL